MEISEAERKELLERMDKYAKKESSDYGYLTVFIVAAVIYGIMSYIETKIREKYGLKGYFSFILSSSKYLLPLTFLATFSSYNDSGFTERLLLLLAAFLASLVIYASPLYLLIRFYIRIKKGASSKN